MDVIGAPLSGSLKLLSLVPVVVLVVTLERPTRIFSGEDFEPAASGEAAHGVAGESKDGRAGGRIKRERTNTRTQWVFILVVVAVVVALYFYYPDF
ncbi:MAG: hypothetical protein ACRDOO_12370 [Actinomadura sp.]